MVIAKQQDMLKMSGIGRLGVEEEFFLTEIDSGCAIETMPEALFSKLSGFRKVTSEYLQSQIEIKTDAVHSLQELASQIRMNRSFLIAEAAQFGLVPMASGTHPTASWHRQNVTSGERYRDFGERIGYPVRRLMTNAFHVHIEVEDQQLRSQVFDRSRYFLPLILALSASSPFFSCYDTKCASYRSAMMGELPCTGIPAAVGSIAEYNRKVSLLVDEGFVGDVGQVWWDIRLSAKFPTVEYRIADSITSINDAVAIVSLIRYIAGLCLGQESDIFGTIAESDIHFSKWQARTFGLRARFIDSSGRATTDISTLLSMIGDRMIRIEEKWPLDRNGINRILMSGNAADRQKRAYLEAKQAGASHEEALSAVLRHLRTETTML